MLGEAFLVVIWAVIDVQGFFWPVLPIAGWGISVVMSAWDVYLAAADRRSRHPARDHAQGQAGHANAVGPAAAVFQYGETRHRTGPVPTAPPER